jgi:hypothetical protein
MTRRSWVALRSYLASDSSSGDDRGQSVTPVGNMKKSLAVLCTALCLLIAIDQLALAQQNANEDASDKLYLKDEKTGLSAADTMMKNPGSISEKWKACRKAISDWYKSGTKVLDDAIRDINGTSRTINGTSAPSSSGGIRGYKEPPLGSEEEYENYIHDYLGKEPNQTRACPVNDPELPSEAQNDNASVPAPNSPLMNLFKEEPALIAQAAAQQAAAQQAARQAAAQAAQQAPTPANDDGDSGLGTMLGILGAVAGGRGHVPSGGIGGVGCVNGQAVGTTVARGNTTSICPHL